MPYCVRAQYSSADVVTWRHVATAWHTLHEATSRTLSLFESAMSRSIFPQTWSSARLDRVLSDSRTQKGNS